MSAQAGGTIAAWARRGNSRAATQRCSRTELTPSSSTACGFNRRCGSTSASRRSRNARPAYPLGRGPTMESILAWNTRREGSSVGGSGSGITSRRIRSSRSSSRGGPRVGPSIFHARGGGGPDDQVRRKPRRARSWCARRRPTPTSGTFIWCKARGGQGRRVSGGWLRHMSSTGEAATRP